MFDRAAIRRILCQRVVNTVLMIVVHVIANQPPQMRFVQRDDMVENFATTASDPALCDSILPGCLNTRALRLQAGCFQEGDHIGIGL